MSVTFLSRIARRQLICTTRLARPFLHATFSAFSVTTNSNIRGIEVAASSNFRGYKVATISNVCELIRDPCHATVINEVKKIDEEISLVVLEKKRHFVRLVLKGLTIFLKKLRHKCLTRCKVNSVTT